MALYIHEAQELEDFQYQSTEGIQGLFFELKGAWIQKTRLWIQPITNKTTQCIISNKNRQGLKYLGKRCLGQGSIWNSWGTEKMKLPIWGIKKSRAVLLKCPRMATTATVMPEK